MDTYKEKIERKKTFIPAKLLNHNPTRVPQTDGEHSQNNVAATSKNNVMKTPLLPNETPGTTNSQRHVNDDAGDICYRIRSLSVTYNSDYSDTNDDSGDNNSDKSDDDGTSSGDEDTDDGKKGKRRGSGVGEERGRGGGANDDGLIEMGAGSRRMSRRMSNRIKGKGRVTRGMKGKGGRKGGRVRR